MESYLPICRVCYESYHNEENQRQRLISPCLCKGSINYIHEGCLIEFIKHTYSLRCELCNTKFAKTYVNRSFTQILKKFYQLLKKKGPSFIKELVIIATFAVVATLVLIYLFNTTDVSESFGVNIALTLLLSIHSGKEHLNLILRRLRKLYFNIMGIFYKRIFINNVTAHQNN